MDKEKLSLLEEKGLTVEKNVPLKNYTSFKIGGPAKYLITVHNEEQLTAALAAANDAGEPVFILGGGSNILVSDKGYGGVVINMCGLDTLELFSDDTILAGAGVRLSRIASFARDNALSGLEFASGIPGTLGGAVYMNAGAYGGEMKDVVASTRFMLRDGTKGEFSSAGHAFGYRKSIFTGSDMIILSSVLHLKKAAPEDISALMKDFNKRRAEKQPLSFPSAGSTFKRPQGDFAGRLIEASGLKGFSVGDAFVSEKHAGFIVNKGSASAKDVYDLINHVKETVKKEHGVSLESEIRFLGEF